MADSNGNGSFGTALGMVETKGWVALVEATDAMTKAANVEIVKTNATGFNKGGTLTVDGQNFGGLFVPDALPTPEPTTLALFGGAFLGMGIVGMRRVRRKASGTESVA